MAGADRIHRLLPHGGGVRDTAKPHLRAVSPASLSKGFRTGFSLLTAEEGRLLCEPVPHIPHISPLTRLCCAHVCSAPVPAGEDSHLSVMHVSMEIRNYQSQKVVYKLTVKASK